MSIESAKRIHREVVFDTAREMKGVSGNLSVIQIAKLREKLRQQRLAELPQVVMGKAKEIPLRKRPGRRRKSKLTE